MTDDIRDLSSAKQLARRRRLDAQAAVWVIRVDTGRAGIDDVRLDKWRARSPDHRLAFERAMQRWRSADGLRAREQMAAREPVARCAPWLTVSAFAFCMALVAGGLHLYSRADFATGTGELRRVALADGSALKLDADSAVDVRYTSSRREVVLLRGRAAFDVRHGDTRPFTVVARGGSTQDIGTSFQVDANAPGREVRVTVTAGRVRVVNASGGTIAGENTTVAYTDDAHPPVRLDVTAGRETAWQRGRLIFDDTPLDVVVATLNRYWRGHSLVVIGRAARLRVSGNFDLNAPREAVGTLAETFGLHTFTVVQRVVVLHAN
ncbi:FecR domain-containing protein [Caballeronia sp. LZ028]|uniref:FecR family protein n=1 Tax=Caballeronia sp. LZ028 TaxID=3038563 RepID=UPI0028672C2D|nr:FecR domain-containing protein [Caballeronia sp. LZ028]MDR5770020.1 FecR domain-containing protein [Caballeronia sp. LZ028]